MTSARIVGGTEVIPFKYPVVSIAHWKVPFCGGVQITNRHVLTAAHCSKDPQEVNTVVIHRHDLTKTDKEESGATYSVINRLIHPQYNKDLHSFDIALWTLDISNQTGDRGLNLKLDDGTIGWNTGAKTTAVGWGRTGEFNDPSDVLLEVSLPVVDPDVCARNLEQSGVGVALNRDVMLCAGYANGGRDTCSGDSGGPLFHESSSRELSLVGITSFGIGCGRKDQPGVYTRISYFKDWITNNIN